MKSQMGMGATYITKSVIYMSSWSLYEKSSEFKSVIQCMSVCMVLSVLNACLIHPCTCCVLHHFLILLPYMEVWYSHDPLLWLYCVCGVHYATPSLLSHSTALAVSMTTDSLHPPCSWHEQHKVSLVCSILNGCWYDSCKCEMYKS